MHAGSIPARASSAPAPSLKKRARTRSILDVHRFAEADRGDLRTMLIADYDPVMEDEPSFENAFGGHFARGLDGLSMRSSGVREILALLIMDGDVVVEVKKIARHPARTPTQTSGFAALTSAG